MSKRTAPKMGVKRKSGAKKASVAAAPNAPRVLHCHSTFAAGGKEMRAVQLMNAFGASLRHSVVSAEPGEMAARAHINRQIAVDYPKKFPSLTGFPSPGRLVSIAKAMKEYDLVLTYNWGAMDAVMAHTVFAGAMGLPPLIHHEDGFNEDEAIKLNPKRNLYRRTALGKASALVVPSALLEKIALGVWKVPQERVVRIPNGVDTKAFGRRSKAKRAPVAKREGDLWLGTLAGLRRVKQLDRMVDAFAVLPDEWKLVIFGEGDQRETIEEVVRDYEIGDRVSLPGAVSDPASVMGLFDIFALSSSSEQFPLSVVEAMAAGLPVAAPDVGDIKSIVAEENRPFIAPAGDITALGDVFEQLADDAELRATIGKANKARARDMFDEADMIKRYRTLYSEAMGRAF